MTITPYPAYEQVFTTEKWRGIFYPLCSVSALPGLPPDLVLHAVATNGVWYNDTGASAHGSAHFTSFQITPDNHYVFNGNPLLFQGYEAVAPAYQQLADDWQRHEADYLLTGHPARRQWAPTAPILPTTPEFDAQYFTGTLHGFWGVRGKYQQTGKFQSTDMWLKGWKEEPQVFFYPATHPEFQAAAAEAVANQEYLLPGFDLASLVPVGLVPAQPYLPDGNDTLLYYSAAQQLVVCINHYS